MKKLLLTSVIALLVTAGFAQDRVALGLKVGFNSSELKLSDLTTAQKSDIKSEASNGFLFGAYGRLKLIGNLSFQPELYYAKKKFDVTGVLADGTVKPDELTLNTWDVPLLAHLRVLDLKVASVYGVAGPVASFNASSKSDLPTFDKVEDANWTFQAGLGAEFWRLTADFRYEWGVKDISKVDIGQKTNVMTFSIGYKLFGL